MKKILGVFLAKLIVCVSSINYSTAAEVLIDSESRLGGLPSPTWTYKPSASKYFTTASSNKGQTLKYKIYWRPANSEFIKWVSLWIFISKIKVLYY